MIGEKNKASFRDPSGFLYSRNGVLFRQINQSYQEHYEKLMTSGLYADLVKRESLIPHLETNEEPKDPQLAYKVIQPEKVKFISYPYEWSFGQFKDAALLTLEVAKRALEYGMILKDASAYNVQYHHGHPILIDTLSFEIYQEGKPWVAYRQFCQHFLAPLALMASVDIRLNQLLRVYIDGVPLDLGSRLLPGKTRLNFGLLTHLHLHAQAQKRYSGQAIRPTESMGRVSKMALLGLMDSLEGAIKRLNWQPGGTEWAEYYEDTNYSKSAFGEKQEIVKQMLMKVKPASVWDLGANTGIFSRLACSLGVATIAFDIDPGAVEINYQEVKKNKEENLLPLVMDLTNPSSAIGWANQERQGIIERGPADVILGLALIHHLAISNNLPLEMVAEFFSRTGKWCIVEFIPKDDSQVQRLLSSREDIFIDYTQSGFEKAFQEYFNIRDVVQVRDSKRVVYLFENQK